MGEGRGRCERRQSWWALALLAMACLAACARSDTSSISVGGPGPAAPGSSAVVAGDGSLWYAHGHQLVRLGTDRGTRTFLLAPGSVPSGAFVEAVHLAPSTAGTVWFVAVFEWQQGRTPGSTAAGFVGRAGPAGLVSRTPIAGGDAIAGGDVLVAGATDGALWTQERRWSGSGADAIEVDGLLRTGVDGSVRRFATSPAGAAGAVTDIVAGQAGTVWAVQTEPGRQSGALVVHVGPGGVLSTSPVPNPPGIVPRGDGSVGIAVQAPDRDVCVAGSIGAAGEVHTDASTPVVDDHRGQIYGGAFGCFTTAGGADGSVWVYEMPRTGPHGTNELPDPPWYVFRVRPDGRRDRWTLPSRDYVAAMAPAPHDAMWFITGRRHQLGVITAGGKVSEGLADLPAAAAVSPGNPTTTRLLPTGGATLYLVTENDRAVRAITVPAR